MCDDPKKNIFNDYKCLTTPKIYHVYCAIITIGYLSFDFAATLLFNHENNTLTY